MMLHFSFVGPKTGEHSLSMKSSHYVCASCPSKMSDLRAHIRESANAFGFDEETVQHLVLAVDEAATNVIRYAYEGRTDCKIEVDIIPGKTTWEVHIRDYGKKCDPAKLKGRELEDIRPGGLGLYFIHQAFDEVHFDHSLAEGTLLILKKSKSPASGQDGKSDKK